VTGYLLKDCAFEELVEAVHIVAAGGSYVSPEIEIGVP
jgi:DNA-binding NarL/FixJ family response regulator